METSLFDYHLPTERIAQKPTQQRDASRLLVVNRKDHSLEHRSFKDITDYLGPSDFLFRNTAKVLPARIFAKRPTGGKVECLLLRPAAESNSETSPAGHSPNSESAWHASRSSKSEGWWCLLRPGKKLPPGSTFAAEDFSAEVLQKNDNAEYLVAFTLSVHSSVSEMAAAHGKMPLPPYISRETEDSRDGEDIERYQTRYANDNKMVAAAAPTAGLHFNDELLNKLSQQGVTFHDLVLHVGMGTFKPLEADNIEDHEIHREIYEISAEAQSALRFAPAEGKRRVCVGTTSVRTIEDYLRKTNTNQPTTYTNEADIFIYPPRKFAGVDALITNFHLPKSTLLCLVSSFLAPGKEDGILWLKEIYQEAIKEEYRFLSYGDAMLIL
ncbi:tRNA preQ1(34) S-adenosylmethionine ribosyltransferase-isomerase QueA [Puniceicoccaceae bacterium K14]|nr:tRNA preQ1(34) S-adenosylmethionine ribosyltransferase-isomerase QueA [Puniceicoccaceae bacterium K14]